MRYDGNRQWGPSEVPAAPTAREEKALDALSLGAGSEAGTEKVVPDNRGPREMSTRVEDTLDPVYLKGET